jgi:hypothetical protein
MSTSQFVCWKDGLPVHQAGPGWRHALGGRTGAIPPSRKHRPVVCPREEYDRAYGLHTPRDEARAIAEKYNRIARDQEKRS